MSTTTRTSSRTRITSRIVATTLVTALAGVGLVMPAASATGPATGSATKPASPSASKSSQDRLQDMVNAIQKTGTVGVVARSTGPRGHGHATAGVADKATGAPVRSGDRFRIASASKTFVATVALQLVGEGRLSLDDTVEDWLPGVVSGNGNDGSRITVRQLLQHTSGLFNYTGDFPVINSVEGFQKDRFTTWTDEQLVAIAMSHKPDFAPGTKWAYSNTGYILAGMIIEKATGNSWQQEVTQRIIRPLRMRHTLAPATHPHIPGSHLNGYSNFGGSGPTIDVTEFNPSAAGAAGAMISTTADMTRFYSALLGGRLLRPAQLAEMKTTVRTPDLDPVWPGASYGLGLLRIPLTCGGSYYSHPGDLPGYTTRNGTSENGRRIVVLNATGDGAPDLSTEKAHNALIDGELCAPGRK
ncbi:serine hydrolase [Streptomyces lunaelactis]|uniref:Serine hydrolase n=1 Tax=Streptomyces lunaelactis TaxID=1535768 RepID=A0A2R4T4E9_9ACTN|nr:serine hydrolase domain-containing protein [Streptomyces lunaelactis]AVZ73954.1 serine hydrolase [Streptomyces lunaelactis]NUK86580.1 beta-lactamase family protein [Streptomyces lunaelactis]NUL02926.1 beta-lactamase family protein [Streptomyces lunaelactis]